MTKVLTYEELLKRNDELENQVKSLEKELESFSQSNLSEENEYKNRLYRINENVNDVVFRFNISESKYEYVSRHALQLFGYCSQEFYTNPFLARQIVHPESRCDFFNYWSNVVEGTIPEYFELRILKKDGAERWIMQKNLVNTDYKGRVIGIEGVVTDITDRKLAEEALVESEAQKEAILNNLPHLAWLKDDNGVYQLVNNTFASKVGKEVNEIIGKTDFDLYSSEDASRYRKEDLIVVSSRKQLYLEEKSQNLFWETFKAPIFNGENDIIGVTGISLEISDRKSNEVEIKDYSERLSSQNMMLQHVNEELKSAKEKAEEADRLKTAFLANMSHEIRTPMNAILGFATLLRDRRLPEAKRADFINLINANCRQLLHIISDIIDISKIEANQITTFNKHFNLNTILKTLVKNFEGQIKSSKNQITIKSRFSFPDSECQVYTDKVRLEQILSNLLSNAIKFTEDGEVEIGYDLNSNTGNIVFFISDTGIGMSEEEQKVIFERFRQISSSYNKQYGGTGLGLSISKGLAKKLGGDIWVQSKINEGSTFYASIPYIKGKSLNSDKIPYDTVYCWDNKTILIAEDEKANFSLLENLILPTKAQILWARNGKEAVKYCTGDSKIDLVIMDIKMPEMNGIEATQLIKEYDSTLPIIAQTAFAMPEDEQNCMKAGCDAYLAKPLRVEDILGKINFFLKPSIVKEESDN